MTVEAGFIRPVVEKENPNTGALLPVGGAQPLEMAALAAAAAFVLRGKNHK
ncbi:MAG: NPXTG-anchored protein [Oscillospiraceae bacterium]|nr:NPXTG-anchored protein [Oscillospiraceae bacterium]